MLLPLSKQKGLKPVWCSVDTLLYLDRIYHEHPKSNTSLVGLAELQTCVMDIYMIFRRFAGKLPVGFSGILPKWIYWLLKKEINKERTLPNSGPSSCKVFPMHVKMIKFQVVLEAGSVQQGGPSLHVPCQGRTC